MKIGVTLVFTFWSENLRGYLIEGGGGANGSLSIPTVLFHVKVTRRINPLAIGPSFWSSPSPGLRGGKSSSIRIKRMFIFHVGVHGRIRQVGPLTHLTFKVPGLAIGPPLIDFGLLPTLRIGLRSSHTTATRCPLILLVRRINHHFLDFNFLLSFCFSICFF